MRRERVWAEIDLDAIRHNLTAIGQLVGPAVRRMVVLKADAYGHGAAVVARAALEAGAAAIGVGDSSEAIELRQAGIGCPILILGAIVPGEAEAVVRYGIATCIHSREGSRLLAAEARRQRRLVPVHLMVDTGMGRLGTAPAGAPGLLAGLAAEPSLVLRGIATHCSTPGDAGFTAAQLEAFEATLARARADGHDCGLRHAAASAALLRYPRARLDMVRPGLLLYGVPPGGADAGVLGLVPALALRTQIIHLKQVPAGTPLGYRRTYITPRPTCIATLPVGYDDGLPLALSGCGEALVRGCRAPLVGAISMDYTLLDVGHVPGAAPGDVVTLIGADGAERIALDQVARQAQTIPYALCCGLGRRVRRCYTGQRAAAPERVGQAPTRFDFFQGAC